MAIKPIMARLSHRSVTRLYIVTLRLANISFCLTVCVKSNRSYSSSLGRPFEQACWQSAKVSKRLSLPSQPP